MTFEKHTPGPWTYAPGYGDEGFRITLGGASKWAVEKGISYAMCLYPEDGAQHAEAEANARLIAAAPDLLAALEGLEELLMIRESSPTMSPLCTIEQDRVAIARAAITKALGEGAPG